MTETMSLILIGSSILVGTMVPGPSFVVVTRAGLIDRRQGFLVAFGVSLASVLFACLALGGLLTVLEQVPSLYLALKIVGGVYLCYLGWRILRAASSDQPSTAEAVTRSTSACQYVGLGVMTQASNPKAALVYASTFAAFLPANPASWMNMAIIVVIFCISAGWYGTVALASSVAPVARVYARMKKGIDQAAGFIVGGLGAAIIYKIISERITDQVKAAVTH